MSFICTDCKEHTNIIVHWKCDEVLSNCCTAKVLNIDGTPLNSIKELPEGFQDYTRYEDIDFTYLLGD